MHRSGSSMVAGMLHGAGVHLGAEADFAPHDAQNPYGYWEDLRFVAINDRLLAHWGGAWDVPPAWPWAWPTATSLAALRVEAMALLQSAPAPVWGWKDPRGCLTAAFWRALHPELRFVVCLREPGEVSRSLRWRGFTSERFGLGLWERYYGELLAATTPAQRIVTHYDRYFHDGEHELQRVLDWLGVRSTPAQRAAALATLAREVRRSWSSRGIADAGRLSEAGRATYATLLDESRWPVPPVPRAQTVAPPAADLASLPLPPPEMRQLVGPIPSACYDNPSGAPVFRDLAPAAYDSVLDFGCGCGRIARQLIQQRPRPRRYLGIDLHRGMVAWCEEQLAPHAPGFAFQHHDAYSPALNPRGAREPLPIPAADDSFSLITAWSVFTHLLEDQARHYLAECARVLRPDGVLHATWFLFDKRVLPMMQAAQNALFINPDDPRNAVIFDRRWLLETAASVGLKLIAATPPKIRGDHWILIMAHDAHPGPAVALPEDDGPLGAAPPPALPPDADRIGLAREADGEGARRVAGGDGSG